MQLNDQMIFGNLKPYGEKLGTTDTSEPFGNLIFSIIFAPFFDYFTVFKPFFAENWIFLEFFWVYLPKFFGSKCTQEPPGPIPGGPVPHFQHFYLGTKIALEVGKRLIYTLVIEVALCGVHQSKGRKLLYLA